MGEAFIGVDVGTSSARAGVFDAAGRGLASARRPIALWRGPGARREQGSADIWRAACAAVREAVEMSGLPLSAFAGIGFDATCSLVVLDREGRSLPVSPGGDSARDTILWMDHRAVAEAREINATGHAALRHVGGAISPEMQPPKLLWLARHAPETFAQAGHFFDLADFLTWKATGSATRSLCTLACKWSYLPQEGRWPREFFDAIGLSAVASDGFARIGPAIATPGERVGGLSAEAAEAMGLPPGLPVGAGLIDAHAGALATLGASGHAPARTLALILGTSSCCMAVSGEPRFLPGLWGPNYGALLPGLWLSEGGQSAFGAAIDHLMSSHPAYGAYAARAGEGFETMEAEIVVRAGGLSEAARLADGLHVLPDFHGNRSPFADPAARAGLFGLGLEADEADLRRLYVAALCGLAQGIAQVVARLEEGGFAFDRIVASGGASRSALVRQIVADATGKPVVSPETREPVLLGAAMLGAVAAGGTDLAGAMASMTRLGATLAPSAALAPLHARRRRAFEALQGAERRVREAMRDDGENAWPRVVIFDCDGVLVDSEPIALARSREALADAGLVLTDEDMRARFLGVSADTLEEAAEAALGAPLPGDFRAKVTRSILDSFEKELKGVEGLREALKQIDRPVCVASSSAYERLRAALRIVGYAALFEPNVFSASEVAEGKPAPDLFLYAARRMGAEAPECLVIEDSVPGVRAARRAGAVAFGFVGGAHAASPEYAKALMDAGAALVFSDMRELPRLIADYARQRIA